MTVAELIEYLKTQPQEVPVAYRIHSEQCVLEVNDIVIETLCIARPDGWVQNYRPDKPSTQYLVLPGN